MLSVKGSINKYFGKNKTEQHFTDTKLRERWHERWAMATDINCVKLLLSINTMTIMFNIIFNDHVTSIKTSTIVAYVVTTVTNGNM